jgi:hypothetical protein
MGRWLRWVVPGVAVALGFVLAASGFVYDLAFAGLPYQDPTPKMQARWQYHSGVASVIDLVGAGVCCSAWPGWPSSVSGRWQQGTPNQALDQRRELGRKTVELTGRGLVNAVSC